jgi:hypothetical protein
MVMKDGSDESGIINMLTGSLSGSFRRASFDFAIVADT